MRCPFLTDNCTQECTKRNCDLTCTAKKCDQICDGENCSMTCPYQGERWLPDPGNTIKAVFHFSRIVAKRTVFHCSVSTQAELMIWTQ